MESTASRARVHDPSSTRLLELAAFGVVAFLLALVATRRRLNSAPR